MDRPLDEWFKFVAKLSSDLPISRGLHTISHLRIGNLLTYSDQNNVEILILQTICQ